MPYHDNFWHKMHERLRIPNSRYNVCLIFFVKSKTEKNQLNYRHTVHVKQYWAAATRSETPEFITPDLWPPNSPDLNPPDYRIWGVLQERVYHKSVKNLNANELKQLLTEAWFGIQQSVADQAIDQWRVYLDACVKAMWKYFEHVQTMCCSATVNNLLWNLHYSFSASQLLISHDF